MNTRKEKTRTCAREERSKHLYYIVKVEHEQCTIKKYKIEPSRLPARSGRNSRADKEENIHIIAEYNANSAKGVNRCGYIGNVKLIFVIELEIVDKCLHWTTSFGYARVKAQRAFTFNFSNASEPWVNTHSGL